MTLRLLTAFCFMLMLLPGGQAQVDYQLAGESAITIHGTSTLHDWKAVVPGYEGIFKIADDLVKKKLKEGAAIEKAMLKFEVETIDGGRGPSMNKKIKTALKSDEHPQIVFELDEPTKVERITSKDNEKFTMKAAGVLSIAGTSQDITLDLEGQRMENGQFHFKTKKPLKMSDFEIEPPSAMFGQIVTKDDIEVDFDLILTIKN